MGKKIKSQRGKAKAAARKLPRATRVRFVSLVKQGHSAQRAAAACGMNEDEAAGTIILNLVMKRVLRDPKDVI